MGGEGGVHWDHCVRLSIFLSVRLSVHMSIFVLTIFPVILGMVVFVMKQSVMQKLVHYLQGHDHSKGFYNQNVTIATISSKLLIHLQPNMVLSTAS